MNFAPNIPVNYTFINCAKQSDNLAGEHDPLKQLLIADFKKLPQCAHQPLHYNDYKDAKTNHQTS